MIEASSSGLHLVSLGSGTPVLVVHGGPGLDHQYLRPWLDPLAQEARLTFVDLRGHGQSERYADPSMYSHATWVADIEQARISLGVDHFVLMAHSWGSFIALEYALKHQEHLLGLALCSTAAALNYTEQALEIARARATEEEFRGLVAALSAPATDDESFRSSWLAALPVYFAGDGAEAIRQMDRGTIYAFEAFNRGMFECMPHYDVTAGLDTIACPTLVLGGRHDWITPPDLGPGVVSRGIAGSELHIFEQSGHFPFIEEQDAFLAVVTRWLARLEA